MEVTYLSNYAMFVIHVMYYFCLASPKDPWDKKYPIIVLEHNLPLFQLSSRSLQSFRRGGATYTYLQTFTLK